jgi:hypothetical protein
LYDILLFPIFAEKYLRLQEVLEGLASWALAVALISMTD